MEKRFKKVSMSSQYYWMAVMFLKVLSHMLPEKSKSGFLTSSKIHQYFYLPQLSWGKVIFSEACVNNSVHGGACVVAPGGYVWFYSGGMHGFIWGGVRGFIWGACVVLFRGACMVLFGEACVVLFRGACVALFGGGVHGFFSFFGYNEIRSMSGRYASYWNAFLLDQFWVCIITFLGKMG